MTTVTVKTLDTDNQAQLYRQYQGQMQPQPVFVELDTEDGELSVDWSAAIGAGMSASVYHGRTLSWPLPRALTATAANELLANIAPMAQAVLDGYAIDWDGSNWVGAPTGPAAVDAIDKIGEWCTESDWDPADTVCGYDAADWFSEGLDEVGVTAETTNEQLTVIAAQQDKDAATAGVCGFTVLEGALEFLTGYRDELREDA